MARTSRHTFINLKWWLLCTFDYMKIKRKQNPTIFENPSEQLARQTREARSKTRWDGADLVDSFRSAVLKSISVGPKRDTTAAG